MKEVTCGRCMVKIVHHHDMGSTYHLGQEAGYPGVCHRHLAGTS